MKRIAAYVSAIIAVIAIIVLSAPSMAKDTIKVEVYDYDRGTNDSGTEISISIGKVQYIADGAKPSELKCVRIWRGPDSLLYDLDPTGANYYGDKPRSSEKMNQVEATRRWAIYVQKFDKLHNEVEVTVRK